MGRPPKNVDVNRKHLEKETALLRKNAEAVLQGEEQDLAPPSRLNANQRKIWKHIVEHLKTVKILGHIDAYLLENGVVAIDRLQVIEKTINQNFEMIMDRQLMNAQAKYFGVMHKMCNDFAMSPQARAKFGILALNQAQEEADPLLKVLKGGK